MVAPRAAAAHVLAGRGGLGAQRLDRVGSINVVEIVHMPRPGARAGRIGQVGSAFVLSAFADRGVRGRAAGPGRRARADAATGAWCSPRRAAARRSTARGVQPGGGVAAGAGPDWPSPSDGDGTRRRLAAMARVRPGEAANPAPPTVARVRLRFAKRGRLRFLSHRDVARSFERAVRRAGSRSRTRTGSARTRGCPGSAPRPPGRPARPSTSRSGSPAPSSPPTLATALDAALPDGLDVLAAAAAEGTPLAERIDASRVAHRAARRRARTTCAARARRAGRRGRPSSSSG